MSKFSENLQNARHQKNMTQEQLASKLYVSKQAVSKWESGKGYPDAEIWPELAEILEVSIDALMGRSIEKAEKTVMVKEKIRIKRFVLILLLLFFIAIPIIIWITSYSLPSRTGFRKIIQIEELANIDLPDHGELETYNFVEWERYNALPPMSQLGYIVFSNKREIQYFNV
jgi:transcriptional regulator with XRE-family HTH domain